MNLTRRILERIAEVELDITPEFRKPEKPGGKLNIMVVDDFLTKMGWINEGGKPVASDDPGAMIVLQTKWHYPGMAGTYITALQRGSFIQSGDFYPDQEVAQAFYWRADWGENEIAPYLDSIVEVATQLVKAYGPTWSGEREPGDVGPSELDEAMKAVGWGPTASSATAVVYTHPGVSETIRVTEDKDDNIVYAEVVLKDESLSIIDPPTVENIVARAKVVKSWA